jgi:hypothetical protein
MVIMKTVFGVWSHATWQTVNSASEQRRVSTFRIFCSAWRSQCTLLRNCCAVGSGPRQEKANERMSHKLFNEAKTTAGAILSEYNKENTSGELERTERHSHVYLQVLSQNSPRKASGSPSLCSSLTRKKTPWFESASELYRPSDNRLSAKLVPSSADRRCRVVSHESPRQLISVF